MSDTFPQPDGWLKLNEVNFTDNNLQIFHIDTRDFGVLVLNDSEIKEAKKTEQEKKSCSVQT